jgi:predicted Zn-dependent peptidase
VAVILDEYKKIMAVPVGEEELRKAKEYMKGHFALGMEGSDDVIGYLATQEVLRHEIMLPKERMKMIERVTAKDVLRVAKDIFRNKKLNLAVIGPHAHKKELEKLFIF